MKTIENPLVQDAQAKRTDKTTLMINRAPNWVAREFRAFAVRHGMSSAKALELCVRILQEKEKKYYDERK